MCMCSCFYSFPSSVLDDCTLLRICLFILGLSFYWCIVAFILLSISFCRSVFFLLSFVLSSHDLMTNFTALVGFLLCVCIYRSYHEVLIQQSIYKQDCFKLLVFYLFIFYNFIFFIIYFLI